jgi:hypothetical protein
VTLQSLLEIAAELDVALIVGFAMESPAPLASAYVAHPGGTGNFDPPHHPFRQIGTLHLKTGHHRSP